MSLNHLIKYKIPEMKVKYIKKSPEYLIKTSIRALKLIRQCETQFRI